MPAATTDLHEPARQEPRPTTAALAGLTSHDVLAIHFCMTTIVNVRVSREEARLLRAAARAEKKPVSTWLRSVGIQEAKARDQRKWRSLELPAEPLLPDGAEADPKLFIRQKLETRHGIHS